MSATTESRVTVPDIGDFESVPVVEILVAVGDAVSAEDPLVTLESDKAMMDVPAPFAGVVRAIGVAIGDQVTEGDDLMTIEPAEGDDLMDEPADDDDPGMDEAGENADPRMVKPVPDAGDAGPRGNGAADAADAGGGTGDGPIYASPSVRRLARELDVPLRGVEGSGRKGRLTVEDVRGIAATPPGERGGSRSAGAGAAGAAGGGAGNGLDLLPWPKVDFEKFGEIERVPRSRIQRISAPNLARNWVMIPHVTHNDEADITELEAWRTAAR